MTKQVQRRRGTATQHTSFTGAEGELSVNTTNKSVHVHDNVTAGGFEAARADMDNVTSSSILTAAGITATTTELNYVDGVTSSIQTQLDGKAGTASPTFTGTLTTANLTATGTTTLAGASTSADITFGDNDKAIFGAGSDLQIYHNSTGSHSYITESGGGSLYIQGTELNLTNAAGTSTYANFVDGGAAFIRYAGATKLATTATGIDVTGTVTADGLTVDKASASLIDLNATASGTPTNYITYSDTGGATAYLGFDSGSNDNFTVYNATATGDITLRTNSLQRLNIDGATGDISFYEDTGTTPKFFWDASAESLGIGTTSPSHPLTIQADGTSGNAIKIIGDSTNSSGRIMWRSSADTAEKGRIAIDTSSNMTFHSGGSAERMRIDSSGHLQLSDSTDNVIRSGLDSSRVRIFGGGTESVGNGAALILQGVDHLGGNYADLASGTGGYINFRIGTSNAMRIDSSGNVGIGVSAPSDSTNNGDNLVIGGESNVGMTFFSSATTGNGAIYFADGNAAAGSAAYRGIISYAHTDDSMKFHTATNEAMRITSSGDLLVGTTTVTGEGISIRGGVANYIYASRNGAESAYFDRLTSDGKIVEFRKDGSTVGSIGTSGGDIGLTTSTNARSVYIGGANSGGSARYLNFDLDVQAGGSSSGNEGGAFFSSVDDVTDLGAASNRFHDIYATNGTIQTSDRNEKQDIAELTDAEQRVAVAAKGLLRKFRWRDAVAEKGDEARTHFGIIAQDLQAAFAAEGLDAGDYAMFISSTWTDEETGEERTRMGVRYSELLAFIIAAI